MTDAKIARVSLSKQVLAEMERLIADGSWTVGTKIPPEPELMQRFGVSRNTLREAMQTLIHSGVLEARQGDGTYILASDRFTASIQSRLKAANLRDTLEVRFALERETAKLAAIRANTADCQRIRDALTQRQGCIDEPEQFVERDLYFHWVIAQACHNSIMEELYQSIAGYLQTLIAFFVKVMPPEDAMLDSLHSDLAMAIITNDVTAAEAVILQMNIYNQSFIEKVLS